jgi:hypothetical protein
MAIVLLMLAIFLRPALEQFRQRSAVAQLERIAAGGYRWDWAPSSPAWIFGSFRDARKHWGDWIIGASIFNLAFDRHELDSLRALPHLRRLDIAASSSGSAVFEHFPKLEEIDVRSGFFSRFGSLKIRDCPKLVRVSIGGSVDVLDISDLPQLQELTLRDGNTSCRIELSRLPDLHTLSVINDSRLIENGVFALHDLPRLESIYLRASIYLHAAKVHAVDLSGLPNLRWLHISDSQLDDVGISSLCGLHELQSLELYHCDVSDAGLAKLDELPSLQALELRGTRVTAPGLAGLGRLPRLRELSVDWSMTAAELQELQRAMPRVIIESPLRLKNKVPPAAVIGL